MSAPLFRGIAPWKRAGDLLGYALLGLLIARFFLPPHPLITVIWITVLLAGAGCIAAYVTLHRRMTRRALDRITSIAADERGARLIREYQRYLQGET